MTTQYIQNNLKNNNSITYTISEKKSYIDGLWGCHLLGYTLKGYITIMRHYYLQKALQMSVSNNLQKGILRHSITQFENFYNCKKNTDERRL